MGCKNKAILNLLAGICILISCRNIKLTKEKYNNMGTPEMTNKSSEFLDSLLKRYPQYFGDILNNKKEFNVQIIYTQINRGEKSQVNLQHHHFNVNSNNYFYPASTVKLPIALLALQKLQELKNKSIGRDSIMVSEADFSGQTPVYNDPTSIDGKPSIAHYIKKILLESDNNAYNRLYEFLGQEYINSEMHKKGFTNVQILHRLNIFLSEEENRNTNSVKFYDGNSQILYEQPPQRNPSKYTQRTDSLGRGFYKNSKLINGPMDFSGKNRISLEDLHKIMVSLIFPDKVPNNERFNITEEDRQFVLKYMSQYPTESSSTPHTINNVNYWPAYCKFLLYGREKRNLPENIRIFNKVGDAYGHLVDVAYVADFKNKIEFFVSAVIYCNTDGILNDDKYDYDSIGLPFMKNLGRVIYEYELKRIYKIRPDLSPLLFTYD